MSKRKVLAVVCCVVLLAGLSAQAQTRPGASPAGKNAASSPAEVSPASPGIFAVAFTNVADNGARLVFTTSGPMRAVVVIRLGTQVLQHIGPDDANEIHRVEITGLSRGVQYQVDIQATDANGVEAAVRDIALTPALREPTFGRFEGKTCLGVQSFGGNFDALAQLAPGMVRVEAGWGGLQPRPGDFDKARLQKLVADVERLRALHIEPLVLLDYCAYWEQQYTRGQMTWRQNGFGPPDNVADWKRYVQTVMTALKGLVRYYEVWNEPDAGYLATGKFVERKDDTGPIANKSLYQDNNQYWLGDRYVPLVMAARQAADEIDPNIQVLAAAWNHDYHGTRGKLCFDRGMFRYIQQYSFHNYISAPQSFARWESMIDGAYMACADQVVFKPYDITLPIAVTEWGMESYDQPPAAAGPASRRDNQLFIAKTVFYYLGLQRVTMLIYHDLVGKANDPFSLMVKGEDGKITATPGFSTYRWLCGALDRKQYKRLPLAVSDANSARAIALSLPDEKTIYVALWQDRLDPNTQLPVVLPAAAVKVELKGVDDGTYQKELLDLTGQVISSASLQAAGSLRWDDTLPEATGKSESEMRVYRLTQKPRP